MIMSKIFCSMKIRVLFLSSTLPLLHSFGRRSGTILSAPRRSIHSSQILKTLSKNYMSSEPKPDTLSKNSANKEAIKAEKLRKKQEEAAAAAAATAASLAAVDILSGNYGDIPLVEFQSNSTTNRIWTKIGSLIESLKGENVLIRGWAQVIRPVGEKMAFLVLRVRGCTVQCVVSVDDKYVSTMMVKYVTGLSRESCLDIEGVVSVPNVEIKGTTQQVEIVVQKLKCVSRAMPNLPFTIEDAARSEKEFERAEQKGEQLVRVGQETRLNNRVLDIRTPANHAIFKVQNQVETMFQLFLSAKDFSGIHSPKLVAGASEGGAAVFKLDYKGKPACLAQSPQLYKQMAICGGFGRVFEVGSVYRAEDSYTHRHLCEFIGLDVEMDIKERYFEIRLFSYSIKMISSTLHI